MNDQDRSNSMEALGAVVALIALLFGPATIVCALLYFGDRHEAVAHHAAHYDSQTGAFTWDQPK